MKVEKKKAKNWTEETASCQRRVLSLCLVCVNVCASACFQQRIENETLSLSLFLLCFAAQKLVPPAEIPPAASTRQIEATQILTI